MREEIYDSQKEEKKQIDFRRLLDKADSQVDQMELLRMVKNYVLQRIPAVFYLQRDEEYRKAAQEFAAFLDNLSLVLAEPDISISEDGSLFCVTTRGSGRNNRRLRTFLENKIICERGYFQVFWKHISDGEKHFLEGYASLYRLLDIIGVVDKTYHSENSPKNVLLLIDEPELHSHPELARCFLYFLTKWIEEVNQENEELYYQLVVFTHSPFLLSDIDKKHVFHLIRKRDGVVTIEHPQKETFAANIHDVLNDSVFLECSVGAVAYERLRALIVGPEEGNSFLFETEEEQEYLISMIGEPILRDAFQQALRRKKIKS